MEEEKTWQDQACWLEELLKATRSEQLSVLGENIQDVPELKQKLQTKELRHVWPFTEYKILP